MADLTLEQGLALARKMVADNALTAMVGVAKDGEEVGQEYKGRQWTLFVPRDWSFGGIPGVKRAEVSFMIMDTQLEGKAVEQWVTQSWLMAMLSLWEMMDTPNREHNLKMLEAQYQREREMGAAVKEQGAEPEPRCSCGKWAIDGTHHPSCETLRQQRTRGEHGRPQRS